MDNLFSDDPQFRRVQYKKLSDNVREWQQEIAALVTERLPKDLGVDVTVVFQKVDDEKGYAIGSAVAVDPGTNSQIGIPIIVKSWHLAPIDIFFKDSKVYPLTDDNIAKIFYQSSVGLGVATDKPPPSMADDVFADTRNPPLGGKYSYSSDTRIFPLLDGTLGKDDIELLKQAALSNPRVLAEYQRRGTFEVLKKWAGAKPKPDEQDAMNRERTIELLTIKKDGPNKYRMYSAPDEVYDPVVISTDRQGVKNFLNMRKAELWDYEQDPLNSLDQYGHFTIEPPKTPYGQEVDGPAGKGVDGSGSYGASLGQHKNPWVFDPLQDERIVRTVDKFGRYAVMAQDGVMAKGWVLPNVVDFDGNAKPIKLFLGKAIGTYQGRIAGIPLNDDANVNLVPDKPESGKIGALVYRDGERVLATVPFQVTSVTVYKNMRSIGVIDYQGNQANLILSPNIQGIVRVKDDQSPEFGPLLGPKANYIVSSKMFFIRMPRTCSVSEGPDDFKRQAVEHLDKNPIKVAMANGRYIFRGGAVSKYASASRSSVMKKTAQATISKHAFDFNGLERHEAEFLLRYWGLGQEKVAEVLDGARNRVFLEVHHLRFPDLPSATKVASPYRVLVRSIRAPIPDLVKIAANLDDAETVDSVLSLGFLNEENISRFAAATPMLWEASQLLAKLLLASRIGMEDIPEENARAALAHLQKVIDGLGRMKMLEEEQEKTSSARKVHPGPVGGRLVEAAYPIGFAR